MPVVKIVAHKRFSEDETTVYLYLMYVMWIVDMIKNKSKSGFSLPSSHLIEVI